MYHGIRAVFTGVLVACCSVFLYSSAGHAGVQADQSDQELTQLHHEAKTLQQLAHKRNQLAKRYNTGIKTYMATIEKLNKQLSTLAIKIKEQANAGQNTDQLHIQIKKLNHLMDSTNAGFHKTAIAQIKQIFRLERTRQIAQKKHAIKIIEWSKRKLEAQLRDLQAKQKEEFTQQRSLDVVRLDSKLRSVIQSRDDVEKALTQQLVALNQQEERVLNSLSNNNPQPQ